MHNRRRVAFERAADDHDIATYFSVRTELDIAHHGNDCTLHRAVDIGVAEHRDRRVAHRSRNPGVAKHRDHGILNLAFAGRRAHHRDDRVGVLADCKLRVVSYGDDAIVVMDFGGIIAIGRVIGRIIGGICLVRVLIGG